MDRKVRNLWRTISHGSGAEGIKVFAGLFLYVLIFLSVSLPAYEQEPFHIGKTIRIIVGLSPGGGYDLWARMIARHIGKHIPGQPTVIVDNMPGAGSIIAANHVYKVAKPDGLTIGHVSGNIFLNQLFKQPGIEFDARRYEFIGAPYADEMVVFVSKASGITSMDKWFNAKNPVSFGGQAPGATFSDTVPRILRAALGLPVKPVSGYKGTTEVRLAIESGELDGNCLSWESGKATWARAMEAGDIIPLLQVVPKPIREIPQVPLAINYAKTDDARQLIELGVHQPPVYARPFMLPPGTPKERVQMLRRAFEATMKDKEFLADTEKARMTTMPVASGELEKVVQGIFDLDPAMVDKLKEILFK